MQPGDSCIPLYPVGYRRILYAQEKKCQLDAETFQGPAKAFAARKRGSSSRDSESPGLADSDFCERLSFFGYLGVTGALMLERLKDFMMIRMLLSMIEFDRLYFHPQTCM